MKKNPFPYEHGFLGLGKMAGVLLEAMLKNKRVRPKQVLISRRNSKSLKNISKKMGVNTTSDNAKLASSCRFLWLGVKPFHAQEVLKIVKPQLHSKTIVLSMMAGVPLSFIKKNLSPKTPCVRLMPNTPAKLGQGVTGVYFPKSFKPQERKSVLKILNTLGTTVTLTRESDFDALTGLSGSGPAFVYAMVHAMIRGGVQSGLTAKQSKHLTLATFRGAIAMLENTKETPEELIAHVVSKGGTTEAGLKILKKYKTAQALTQAVKRAAQHSKQISQTIGTKN